MLEPGDAETRVEEAKAYIRGSMPLRVRTGIVLGSGLGGVRRAFQTIAAFPYSSIPGFPVSTVKGHRGEMVFGKRGPATVVIMDGRVHCYEGYRFDQVTFPVRVLGALGVSTMIVTNAAGAVSTRLKPGDIMLIEDHIDLIWKAASDLSRGPQVLHKPYYSKRLLEKAEGLARQMKIPVKRGVLIAESGPTYETPAEVEFARKIGADAATMSTIPEVTVCHRMGIAVMGMSLITNVAASHAGDHEQVVEFARRGSKALQRLIVGLIGSI
jgi:purine-nucleoside phosphorylase